MFTKALEIGRIKNRIEQPFEVLRLMHRHCKEATGAVDTLAGTRLHDLRHTFATERVGLMHTSWREDG